jgi:hypothetical protein
MDSKIFTQAEQKEIKKQEKGDYSDKQGLFSGRIKPKIIEILSFDRKWLKRLINPKRRKKR